MKLFLDANVLVSVVNYELPVFTYSSRVLSLQKHNSQFELYTSPICLAITFYFAQKKCSNQKARKKIQILSEQIGISTVGLKEVLDLNKNKKVLDYEDGLQYYSALSAGCDAIITEDLNDFHFSEIPVYTSKDFILNILE